MSMVRCRAKEYREGLPYGLREEGRRAVELNIRRPRLPNGMSRSARPIASISRPVPRGLSQLSVMTKEVDQENKVQVDRKAFKRRRPTKVQSSGLIPHIKP